MTPTELRSALEAHAAACREALPAMRPRPDMPQELRAYLSGADLSRANLSGANRQMLLEARPEAWRLNRLAFVLAAAASALPQIHLPPIGGVGRWYQADQRGWRRRRDRSGKRRRRGGRR